MPKIDDQELFHEVTVGQAEIGHFLHDSINLPSIVAKHFLQDAPDLVTLIFIVHVSVIFFE